MELFPFALSSHLTFRIFKNSMEIKRKKKKKESHLVEKKKKKKQLLCIKMSCLHLVSLHEELMCLHEDLLPGGCVFHAWFSRDQCLPTLLLAKCL